MNAMIWLGILAVLLVIEAVTVGLTTIWFAGGAVIALITVFFGGPVWLQVVLFLGVSFVLLIFTRPAAVRLLNRGTEATNVNAVIGKVAVVTEEIDNLRESGQVRVGGMEWSARAVKDGLSIPKDTTVKIREVQGVKVIVEVCEEKEESL